MRARGRRGRRRRSFARAGQRDRRFHPRRGRHLAEAVEANVSNEESCRAAVQAAVGFFGALHLLVNNVGIAIGGTLTETTTDQFDKMVQVNLRSHFLTMRYAVPEIAKAGGGAIVNVSSLAALRSNRMVSYEATKAALLGLSRSAAMSHARDKIRVNTILPGLINSSMVAARRRSRGAGGAANSDAPAGDAVGDCERDRLSALRRSLVYHRHGADRRRRPERELRSGAYPQHEVLS